MIGSKMKLECSLDIAMPAVNVAAYVCAYALAKEFDDAKILWPHTIMLDEKEALSIRAHAAYKQGIVVSFDIMPETSEAKELLNARATEFSSAVQNTLHEWEAALSKTTAIAAPLAPVLEAYFDKLYLANKDVDVVYPNGNLFAKGKLLGLDVFGRAIVHTQGGQELSFGPLQYRIAKPSC